MTENSTITAAQTRAARALLGWSQQDLAREAKVAASTVADFERGQRTPVPNNLDAMRGALEKAAIQFLPGGATIGPPLPGIPAAATSGVPVRWIDATGLSQWAEQRPAQDTMPELLSRLIRASTGHAATLCFPSGDSVQLAGWDGTCGIAQGTEYVPEGISGWEIGTQRRGLTGKADEDYEKRTDNPLGLDRPQATFVFVTPRRWPQKAEWVRKKRAEGKWADVRAYDADDLVHWIELNPAVGLWLAAIMGKRPEGLRQLHEAWEEWSLSTKFPMPEDLTIAGRDEEASHVLRWLREPASVLAIQGESPEEAMAFLHAAIHQLPPEYRIPYHARCVVVATADAARMLGDSLSPLIMVLDSAEPGLAARLAQRRHHVYTVYGSDAGIPEEVRRLPRPPRDAIEQFLVGADIEKERAESLARDSARSLAVLRRLIPLAPGRAAPPWSNATHARALIPALLAGVWDENEPGDRAILERLSQTSYSEFSSELAPWVGLPDSPLRKAGATWKIASPRDAWALLARYVSAADLDRFAAAALEVLGSSDPRFEIEAETRWLASAKGVKPPYSGYIRKGMAETLILLSVFGTQAKSVTDTGARAERIVRGLLDGADARLWWSLSRDLDLLAEASPEGFLAAVDASLDRNDPPLKALFDEDGGPFGAEHLSGLLWALETLAWSAQYLGRVAGILARLDSLDPGGRWQNRPANSLRHIFLLWLPQTQASLDQRLRVLDLLRKREQDSAWKLMLGILPRGHDSSTPSPQPRWRDFPHGRGEVVTYALIAKGAAELSRRLLEDVGYHAGRWVKLIEILPDLAPDRRAEVMRQLSAAAPHITDRGARLSILSALRELLHRHREIPDADWSIPAGELDDIEQVYEALEPDDLIDKFSWLFSSQGVHLLRPVPEDWEANEKLAATERRQAVKKILAKNGVDAVFAFARAVDRPELVGVAVAEGGGAARRKESILKRALLSADRNDAALAHGMMYALFGGRDDAWPARLLERAAREAWGTEASVRILLAMPEARSTWDRAAAAGKDVEDLYWQRTNSVIWVNGDAETISHAIEKLLAAARARYAVNVASHALAKGLSSELLARTLEAAAREPWADIRGHNDITMFRHSVEEILKHLDKTDGVGEERLARLEWSFLPLLRHSRRPPVVLHKILATNPEFFVQVLSKIFRPSADSGVEEPPPTDAEQQKAIASQAFDLLHSWQHVPGMKDAAMDAAALEDWVRQARILCARTGRADIGDQQIGQILAWAPGDADGAWPAIPVRNVIEITRSRHLEIGVTMGVMNKQGVTWRSLTDGGEQERAQARQHRDWSKATELEWPRTSALLSGIATTFEQHGQMHDHDAERVGWS